MHGLALALKAGVPALGVDPVAGGGKVSRQAEALGWPAVPASGGQRLRSTERMLAASSADVLPYRGMAVWPRVSRRTAR